MYIISSIIIDNTPLLFCYGYNILYILKRRVEGGIHKINRIPHKIIKHQTKAIFNHNSVWFSFWCNKNCRDDCTEEIHFFLYIIYDVRVKLLSYFWSDGVL